MTAVSKNNVCDGNRSDEVIGQGQADEFEKAADGTSFPEFPNPPTTCPTHCTLELHNSEGSVCRYLFKGELLLMTEQN